MSERHVKGFEETYNEIIEIAQDASNNGNFIKAVESYKEALTYHPKQIQVMGELCWCLGQANRLEEMLETAKKALLISQKRTSEDNIGRFYFYIAQYYKVTGQYAIAIKYLTLAIKNKPYFIANYVDSAFCHKKLDNYSEAVKLYELALSRTSEEKVKDFLINLLKEAKVKRDKKSPELEYIGRGVAYEKKGDYKSANAEFTKAVEISPNTEFLGLYVLFENEIKLGKDYYKAIGIGHNLVLIFNRKENHNGGSLFLESVCVGLCKCYKAIGDENNSEKYYKLAECYSHINNAIKAYEKNDFEKSLEEYKKALQIRTGYDIIDGIIESSLDLKLLEEVEHYAQMGLKLAKVENEEEYIAKYYSYLGIKCDMANDLKCGEFFEKALQKTKDIDNKLKYTYSLAHFFIKTREYSKAIEEHKKCLEYIKDGAVDIYDIPSDIVKLQEVLDGNSDLNNSTKHYNLGGKYFNERKMEEAASEMKIALSYIPEDLDAMDVLNRCLFSLKRTDECMEICYEGFLISHRDHDYRFLDMFCYNLANCFYNNKQYDKALVYFQHALEVKPQDIDYLYFTGACYRHLGELEKAIDTFKLAHEIDPKDKGVTQQLAMCKSYLHGINIINKTKRSL